MMIVLYTDTEYIYVVFKNVQGNGEEYVRVYSESFPNIIFQLYLFNILGSEKRSEITKNSSWRRAYDENRQYPFSVPILN